MKIYFVRHGETYINKHADLSKRTYKRKRFSQEWNPDAHPEWFDMTPKGHKQAKNVAKKLAELVNEPAIYCSNEKRSRETAEHTEELLGIRIKEYDSRLNEYEDRPDPKETKERAFNRINECINDIIKANHSSVIIFAHKGIMRIYFAKKLTESPEEIENCEIIETEVVNNSLTLLNRYLSNI